MDRSQHESHKNGDERAESDSTTRSDIVTALYRQRTLSRWFAAVAVATLTLNATLTVLFGMYPNVFGPGLVVLLLVPSFIGLAITAAPLKYVAKGVSAHLGLIKPHEERVRVLLRKERRLRGIAGLPWGLSLMGVLSAGLAVNRGDTSWHRYVTIFQIGLLLLGSVAICLAYRSYAKESEENDLDRST